ncbi:hypothetical protein ACP4OV_019612 [Aristida adscensionis]
MAELWSLTSLYILLGVLAAAAVAAGAVLCAVRCLAGGRHDGGGAGKVGGGGDRKLDGLLDKGTAADGGRGPEAAGERRGGEAEPCPICKARLGGGGGGGGGGGEGPCRRLRPCGHVYHAECIGLWLQRKPVCPVCRARVDVSRAEIIDAVV